MVLRILYIICECLHAKFSNFRRQAKREHSLLTEFNTYIRHAQSVMRLE